MSDKILKLEHNRGNKIVMSWEVTGGLWYAIKFAVAWFLTPLMLILSAILKRKITLK